VLVWLHGGGFTAGAGSDYDPTRMAVQGGVIVVTVDFRLGVYGFFGHPGLPGSGTFGLLDQQAALRWVWANIGAFGGDPGGDPRLAIRRLGRHLRPSDLPAGGRLVPAGDPAKRIVRDGLAQGRLAIGTPAGSFFKPLSQIEQARAVAADWLGCGHGPAAEELACLRTLPAAALNAQYSHFGVAATGTTPVPLDPDTALRTGRFHRVPIITGHTRDEQRLIAGIQAAISQPITAAQCPNRSVAH
jgi:para-nitrobenzyl esterase